MCSFVDVVVDPQAREGGVHPQVANPRGPQRLHQLFRLDNLAIELRRQQRVGGSLRQRPEEIDREAPLRRPGRKPRHRGRQELRIGNDQRLIGLAVDPQTVVQPGALFVIQQVAGQQVEVQLGLQQRPAGGLAPLVLPRPIGLRLIEHRHRRAVAAAVDQVADALGITLTDTLPVYTDRNDVLRIAAFDAEQNSGWTLNDDGTTVSKTYTGTDSSDVLLQIYNDELHLRFPGLPFETLADGTLRAELTNTVSFIATPSNESAGETHPEGEDSLLFRMTDDPIAQGRFSKTATKGDIYDVDVYKTNPYPWNIALSNERVQPLRHIVIQDRKIVENGEVAVDGLDEALKFVRLQSNTTYSALPAGKTYADIVEKVVAYYTDESTDDFPVTQLDDRGNFTVTFDEDKVCDGYDIVFADDYAMQYNEKVNFRAYTVYRDPEGTHVPEGASQVTYPNTARSVNSYQNGDQTEYVYLLATHSYNMLPSTEKLAISKLTLCNDETTKLPGKDDKPWGGTHVGDHYMYQLTPTGSLLEPSEKEYEDLRIVDLLPGRRPLRLHLPAPV